MYAVVAMPYWGGTILCAIVLAATAIAVLKADTTADLVENVDEKVKAQTAFIRLLTVDAENLLSRAKTDAAGSACKKVYEAARYSDPMSSGALAFIEQQISYRPGALIETVAEVNEEKSHPSCGKLSLLLARETASAGL